jgi:hypothetical protein
VGGELTTIVLAAEVVVAPEPKKRPIGFLTPKET